MNTQLLRRPGDAAFNLPRLALLFSLLLAAVAARGATSFTTTNWVAGVPVPGIQCTNAAGQVYVKGNVHVHRVVSANAQIAGRLTASMDLAVQTDGTANFGGPAYLEYGTWDSTGTKFTPSGGVWDLQYSGVAQADGCNQVHLVGYGVGGTIDGQRVECTATKGPGASFDPAVPYISSGTIQPAPVNTSVVVDNFDNNYFDPSIWSATGAGSGTLSLIETNQQLTLVGAWPSATYNVIDHTAWIWSDTSWGVPNGQTVELRTDLASLTPAAGGSAGLGLYHSSQEGYGITKAADWVCLWKELSSTMVVLSGTRVTTSNTNVALVFALTPASPNVILTGKVLDRSGAVLHQLTFVDTPAADSSLSQAAFAQLTGGQVCHDVGPDTAGAPWTSGTSLLLGTFQDTDGQQPPATVTFDNVVLRTCEVPPVGIERAVRLTWPAPIGANYLIEAAPTVNGSFLPVQATVAPSLQQLTLPASDTMQFYRVQPAP